VQGFSAEALLSFSLNIVILWAMGETPPTPSPPPFPLPSPPSSDPMWSVSYIVRLSFKAEVNRQNTYIYQIHIHVTSYLPAASVSKLHDQIALFRKELTGVLLAAETRHKRLAKLAPYIATVILVRPTHITNAALQNYHGEEEQSV